MAESGSFNTSAYSGRYLKFSWSIKNENALKNYIDISWKLVGAGGATTNWYRAGSFKVVIDGDTVYSSATRIKLYNGTVVASGTKRINNASNRTFSASAQAGIYTVAVNCKGSKSWTLPTISIDPTLPKSIKVVGEAGGSWVDKDSPNFSISWSGANSGTYTISEYSIDVSKYGENNWTNTGSFKTSATSGNITRAIKNAVAGDKYQVRIGMKTTNGKWWGHTQWNGVLNIFSNPTPPNIFSAPSLVEIDSGFNLTWSGATSGSNGIAGYDLEARAFDGVDWTDWTTIFNTKNQSSYSVPKIKDLSVGGINFTQNGENIKFQYRIRTTDGQIGVSEWVNSVEIGIQINSPTAPRKFIY